MKSAAQVRTDLNRDFFLGEYMNNIFFLTSLISGLG